MKIVISAIRFLLLVLMILALLVAQDHEREAKNLRQQLLEANTKLFFARDEADVNLKAYNDALTSATYWRTNYERLLIKEIESKR